MLFRSVSDPSPDPTRAITQGVLTLVASMLAALGVFWWISRRGDRGLGGAVLQAELAESPLDQTRPAVGIEGIAMTDLRPVGRVDFGGRVSEVRAAAWISRGTRVRVVDAGGPEPIVESVA